MEHTYSIKGMTCDACRNHVEKALREVDGVSKVDVDLKQHKAHLKMNKQVPLASLQKKLEEDGGRYSIGED